MFSGKDYPVLVDVDEVNQNLNNYLILDIRVENLYHFGHIPGAINLDRGELLTYLNNSDSDQFKKIVLVSNTGQIANYAACLLEVAGFKDICVLDRGMTYWNKAFSEEFKNAKGDGKWWETYDLFQPIKPNKRSSSPKIEFSISAKSIKEKIVERIQLLLRSDNNSLFISASRFSDSYNNYTERYDGNILIYTAMDEIHYIHAQSDRDLVWGPKTVMLYEPPWDFKGHDDLFKLRLDKNIVMYSPTGQISSFWEAYLHLIGYENAVSIKYGSIAILGFRYKVTFFLQDKDGNIWSIEEPTDLTPYFFNEDQVRNYQYETGP